MKNKNYNTVREFYEQCCEDGKKLIEQISNDYPTGECFCNDCDEVTNIDPVYGHCDKCGSQNVHPVDCPEPDYDNMIRDMEEMF